MLAKSGCLFSILKPFVWEIKKKNDHAFLTSYEFNLLSLGCISRKSNSWVTHDCMSIWVQCVPLYRPPLVDNTPTSAEYLRLVCCQFDSLAQISLVQKKRQKPFRVLNIRSTLFNRSSFNVVLTSFPVLTPARTSCYWPLNPNHSQKQFLRRIFPSDRDPVGPECETTFSGLFRHRPGGSFWGVVS